MLLAQSSLAGALDFIPPIRKVCILQTIIVPTFAMKAFEATVLNGFLFRQTYAVPRATVLEPTFSRNLNYQNVARKRKFGHFIRTLPGKSIWKAPSLNSLQRPFVANEVQMQTRHTIRANAASADRSYCRKVMLCAGHSYKATCLNIQ